MAEQRFPRFQRPFTNPTNILIWIFLLVIHQDEIDITNTCVGGTDNNEEYKQSKFCLVLSNLSDGDRIAKREKQ